MQHATLKISCNETSIYIYYAEAYITKQKYISMIYPSFVCTIGSPSTIPRVVSLISFTQIMKCKRIIFTLFNRSSSDDDLSGTSSWNIRSGTALISILLLSCSDVFVRSIATATSTNSGRHHGKISNTNVIDKRSYCDDWTKVDAALASG